MQGYAFIIPLPVEVGLCSTSGLYMVFAINKESPMKTAGFQGVKGENHTSSLPFYRFCVM